MKHNSLKQIEYDVLMWYASHSPLYGQSFLSQIERIVDAEREFTGQGAFASFTLSDNGYKKVYKDKSQNYDRLDGLAIFSDEFIHECPVSLKIEEDGKIDYIEFEFGFKEEKYPTHYTLEPLASNYIDLTQGG